MTELKQEHFDKLVECCRAILAVPPKDRKSAWVGKSTRAWLTSVQKGQGADIINANPQEFCAKALDRGQLSEKIARSRDNPTDKIIRDLVIDILAWGEMGPNSARAALPNWDDWKAPCIELAQGCDAGDAYDQFHSLQRANKLPGMGPAYYTKLIYFLGKGDGLVMDQWTSRSINLLFGKEIIHLTKGPKKKTRQDYNFRVNNINDRKLYKKYNELVAEISLKLTESLSRTVGAAQAEEYLFSFSTDRRRSKRTLSDYEYKIHTAWRRYVEENHRP